MFSSFTVPQSIFFLGLAQLTGLKGYFSDFQPTFYHYSVGNMRTLTMLNFTPFTLHPEPPAHLPEIVGKLKLALGSFLKLRNILSHFCISTFTDRKILIVRTSWWAAALFIQTREEAAVQLSSNCKMRQR